MLIDNINLPITYFQSEYQTFLDTYDVSMKGLWDSQWKFEGINGSDCRRAVIAQYWGAFYLVGLIQRRVLDWDNNYTTIKTDFAINTVAKNLACNDIDYADVLSIFNLTIHRDETHISYDNGLIEFFVEVSTASSTLRFTSNVSSVACQIDWGDGKVSDVVDAPAQNGHLYVNKGRYKVSIRGDLSTIIELTFNTPVGYRIIWIRLSRDLTNLSIFSITAQRLLSANIDDLIVMIDNIAWDNNITGGTLNVSGGDNEAPSEPASQAAKSECILTESLTWTVTREGDAFTCSDHY